MKNYIMFMHLPCIYETPIILSLFKIGTLRFTMEIQFNNYMSLDYIIQF